MRMVFVIPNLPWPLTGGQEIIAHHTIRTLLDHQHEIHLITTASSPKRTTWPLTSKVTIHHLADQQPVNNTPHSYTHKRWLRYFGIDFNHPDTLAKLIASIEPNYIECLGQQILPLMSKVKPILPNVPVTWMGADDWCLHHLSNLKSCETLTQKISTFKQAFIMGAYQFSYRNCFDAVYMVSKRDTTAGKRFSRFKNVITIPNGVDTEYFKPEEDITPEPNTAVFWGRLDFTPNVDAVRFICEEIWPAVTQQCPQARCNIVGFSPTVELQLLMEKTQGIQWQGPADDIRLHIHKNSIALMPMRTGAGIKNKLLEAASTGKTIITTSHATSDLNFSGSNPFTIADSTEQITQALLDHWKKLQTNPTINTSARDYVLQNHQWEAAATTRESFITQHVEHPPNPTPTHSTQKEKAA